MENLKWLVRLLLLIITVVLGVQTQKGYSQECAAQLTNLNVCAPFVMPGTSNTVPSPDCCQALQSVQQDCLCNTLRIASRLPSQCSIPALTCNTN